MARAAGVAPDQLRALERLRGAHPSLRSRRSRGRRPTITAITGRPITHRWAIRRDITGRRIPMGHAEASRGKVLFMLLADSASPSGV